MNTAMNTSIKAIASDIDGTLLNSKSELTSETIKAIQKVVEAGYLFIFATGRHHVDVADLMAKVNVKTYIVSANGGCILDTEGTQLKRYAIDSDTIDVLKNLKSANDVVINMYQGDKWIFSKNESWVVNEHVRPDSPFKPELFDWNDFQPNDVIKFFYTADTDTLLKIQSEISNTLDLSSKVNVYLSCSTMLEVVSKQTSKSLAISYILQQHGLSMDNVVTFGDGMNDYEMLKNSGMGVLMGNANPQLKTLLPNCQIIDDNDSNAVAHFLNQL